MNCIVCNKEIAQSNYSNAILCGSKLYHIGEETNSPMRGFGGNKYKIKFFDGREVVSTNLWYNGEIPESHKDLLPDNAEFVR